MSDREFYDIMRQRVLRTADETVRFLTPSTSDGMLAPHVAAERIIKVRKLARQMNVLADWMEVL